MVIHDPAVGRRSVPVQEVSKRFTGVVLEAWPTDGFERKTERARVRIWDLLRRTHGFAAVATQVLMMSLVLEAIGLVVPIGFQLVLDDVVVSNDRDLLTLIALGLGLVIAFRALIDFVRSWAIMVAGSSLTLQWKMSLFRHLLLLPLSFFERRHAGEVASRFISIDRIQQTLSTASISPVVDGAMAFVLVGMMWLYEPLARPIRDRDHVHLRTDARLGLPALPSGQRGSGRLCCVRELSFPRIAARDGEHQSAGDW